MLAQFMQQIMPQIGSRNTGQYFSIIFIMNGINISCNNINN